MMPKIALILSVLILVGLTYSVLTAPTTEQKELAYAKEKTQDCANEGMRFVYSSLEKHIYKCEAV